MSDIKLFRFEGDGVEQLKAETVDRKSLFGGSGGARLGSGGAQAGLGGAQSPGSGEKALADSRTKSHFRGPKNRHHRLRTASDSAVGGWHELLSDERAQFRGDGPGRTPHLRT
jgi:hypothetical protein